MADTEVEDSDLSAIIAAEIRDAQNYDNTDIAQQRSLALRYMKGEMPDLPARPNGSTQTSRDTPDTISWILPGIVRTMTASDEMVKYEALEPGQEQWSRDATEYMNFSFFRENEGYRILYNGTYDALTLKNGVVSSYWEPPKEEVKTFRDKTEMELAVLVEEGWEPVSQKPGKPTTDLVMDQMGNVVEAEVPTYTVKMRRVTKRGRICDHTCKPENLILNGGTTIEDARFVAYLHDDKTRSDLMEMADAYGWDTEVIRNLGADNRFTDNEVDDARYSDIARQKDSPVRSGDPIDLYECYIKLDVDGDGISELVQVFFAGDHGQGTVLGWEEWEDDVPYTDIPCYPIPHRFDGESVADRTMDIQRVKTVLLRQGLDNLYAVNMPMREVEAGTVENPDILVNPKFGGIIWRKKGSVTPIVPHVVPYIADKAFAALEYMDGMIAKRTGVSKTTMALDPETLQNQSATASQLQHDAGYSQVELVARNMAELGWVRFFKKRLKLAIKYEQVRPIPSKEGTQMEDGSTIPYREVDPSKWSPDMACSIDVGLGTGSRDRDMQMLKLILDGQVGMADRLSMAGFKSKAIEFIPKIRTTAVRMAESSGLKNADDYYPEISDEEVEAMKQAASQPQPDPAVQLEQMKGQIAKELKGVDAQVKMREAEMKAQGEVVKNQAELEADLATKEADRQNALIIEQQKAQLQLEMQARDHAFQLQLERERMANAAHIAAMKPDPKPAGKEAP